MRCPIGLVLLTKLSNIPEDKRIRRHHDLAPFISSSEESQEHQKYQVKRWRRKQHSNIPDDQALDYQA